MERSTEATGTSRSAQVPVVAGSAARMALSGVLASASRRVCGAPASWGAATEKGLCRSGDVACSGGLRRQAGGGVVWWWDQAELDADVVGVVVAQLVEDVQSLKPG